MLQCDKLVHDHQDIMSGWRGRPCTACTCTRVWPLPTLLPEEKTKMELGKALSLLVAICSIMGAVQGSYSDLPVLKVQGNHFQVGLQTVGRSIHARGFLSACKLMCKCTWHRTCTQWKVYNLYRSQFKSLGGMNVQFRCSKFYWMSAHWLPHY